LPDGGYSILVTGVGGTGIITIGALLGMAAHLDGVGCSVLDLTGVAQKNGAVMSHVRLSRAADQTRPVRIGSREADLILGCDLVVAASAAALDCIERGKTKAIVNADLQPTAQSVIDPDLTETAVPFKEVLTRACSGENVEFVEATSIAAALFGDSLLANVFLLGYAYQRGLVPLSHSAIERAIDLNGVDVGRNRRAFQSGRKAAQDRRQFAILLPASPSSPVSHPSLDALLARRERYLCEFQNTAYAGRYRDIVNAVREAENRVADGRAELAEAVAFNLFKLMAYKDEYEVARLHTDGELLRSISGELEGDFRIEFHLAIPLLSRRDPQTGRLRKRRYGHWMLPLMSLLARLKWLRGTRIDPFGYSAERRAERRLIADYACVVAELAAGLRPDNHALAVEIAELPQLIRGFGQIKLEAIERARLREATLMARFRTQAEVPREPATAA
jgi:indolepyruvate ferredoxin oxidoreductase